MTDNTTLPRAVIEQVREAFKELDYASEPYVNEIARTALAALDAALVEPDAKREPATREQVSKAYSEYEPYENAVAYRGRLYDFEAGFRAAERFHGITKEDK